MTDNKTIIDGADVSKCEHSFKQFDNWVGKDIVSCDCTLGYRCEPKVNHCKFYTNFLTEKLQAKEQECEELKSENFTFEELVKTQENLIDKYKQALDEIDKQIKLLSNRVPLFEIEQIAKDLIKIQDIINKTKEQ